MLKIKENRPLRYAVPLFPIYSRLESLFSRAQCYASFLFHLSFPYYILLAAERKEVGRVKPGCEGWTPSFSSENRGTAFVEFGLKLRMELKIFETNLSYINMPNEHI